MANKDLTSLKVYGNDDPAGSVYKVSGGSGEGSLILTSATETVEGSSGEITYLTHTDGSIVTWQEIYDALASGVYVVHVESGAEEGTHTAAHMAQQSRIVLAFSRFNYWVAEVALNASTGELSGNRYVAVSATDRLVFQDNTAG